MPARMARHSGKFLPWCYASWPVVWRWESVDYFSTSRWKSVLVPTALARYYSFFLSLILWHSLCMMEFSLQTVRQACTWTALPSDWCRRRSLLDKKALSACNHENLCASSLSLTAARDGLAPRTRGGKTPTASQQQGNSSLKAALNNLP